MTDLDKMARELLAGEYERDRATHAADCIRREATLTRIEHRSVRAIRAALLTAPPGWTLVPVEFVDVCWNVVDNLNDMPINVGWAEKTASKLRDLLTAEPQVK